MFGDNLTRQILRQILTELEKQTNLLEFIANETDENGDILQSIDDFLRSPADVKHVFTNSKGEQEQMADLVLEQNGTKTDTLHYVDSAGNDLGAVPVADSPSFSVDQPAELSISAPAADGSVTIGNTNTGTADVDVNLTGSVASKGFSNVKVVTCKGTGVTPPTPAGVNQVFS